MRQTPVPNGTPPDANPNLLRCGRCQVARFCLVDCQKACWPDHKKECRRPNYIIEFHLAPEHIKDPSVKRTLSCPAESTFEELHMALQDAFGWAFTHSYDFAVLDLSYDASAIDIFQTMQNRMAMSQPGGTNMNPDSAQRQYVMRVKPKGSTLTRCTRARVGTRARWRSRRASSSCGRCLTMKSGRVCPPSRAPSRAMTDERCLDLKKVYVYDFGDNWEHYMKVVGREPPLEEEYFRCLSGEGHYVAEDVGSNRGWNRLKDAYAAANPTKEQRENMEWFETECSNKDPKGCGGTASTLLISARLIRSWPAKITNKMKLMAD